MKADWRRLIHGKHFIESAAGVQVMFADERRHFVSVKDEGDQYRLSTKVLKPSKVVLSGTTQLDLWKRNRWTSLAAFTLDERGWLIGESWVPKAGLTRLEFETYVENLATESDRLEFLLSGADTY